MSLPNLISLLRMLSAPLFIWLMFGHYTVAAMWVFILAGVTDALDGFIAKQFKMETELGKYLDPLADKLLLLVGFVTLTALDLLPLWLALLVVTRDVMIVGGALVYQVVTGKLHMEPLWSSKVNTCVQMGLLMVVLLNETHGVWIALQEPFVWLTAVTTLVSGSRYVLEWSRRAMQQEHGNSQ